MWSDELTPGYQVFSNKPLPQGWVQDVVPVSSAQPNNVRNSFIQEGPRAVLLLLCIERSQLIMFRHLAKMPPGCLLGEAYQACSTGMRP